MAKQHPRPSELYRYEHYDPVGGDPRSHQTPSVDKESAADALSPEQAAGPPDSPVSVGRLAQPARPNWKAPGDDADVRSRTV
jgi:hypothetical protein